MEQEPHQRKFIARLQTKLFHLWFLISRPMTLGVRAAAFDAQGRVFLVKHSYVPGWHLPGGGVERGESAYQALCKELREEGHLEIIGDAMIKGVFFNTKVTKRDHVILYECNVKQSNEKRADFEIIDSGFFALDQLPSDTTQATLRRLAELRDHKVPSQYW